MLKRVTVFLSSTLLVKAMPPIIGFILAKESGNSVYAGFVSFILFSSLISAISVMGSSAQVVSLKGQEEARKEEYLRIIGCGLLFLIICTVLPLIAVKLDLVRIYLIDSIGYEGVLMAFLYSLGLFFVYTSTARLNNALLINQATVVWFGYSIMTVAVTVFWYLLDKSNLFLLVSLMAVSALITGALGYRYAEISGSIAGSMVVKEVAGYKKILIRQISFSFSGAGIAGVFFYYQNILSLQSTEDGVFFSFFYQLFALIIYVPSALGNIVVPRLVKKENYQVPLEVYLYYFVISFFLCIVVFIVSPWLFSHYGLDMQLYGGGLFLTLLMVSLVAAVNSYSTQVLVAHKNLNLLMVSIAAWSFVSLGLTAWLGVSVQSVSVSLLAAYLISSFGVVFGIYKLGYFKYFD